MRILVVEDEPSIANFVRQGLSEAGYAVDVAWDGEEGLAYALAADYDALVLDIMLPRMDGLDLLSLCVLIALLAALASAWNASGEKPLNVLRYE